MLAVRFQHLYPLAVAVNSSLGQRSACLDILPAPKFSITSRAYHGESDEEGLHTQKKETAKRSDDWSMDNCAIVVYTAYENVVNSVKLANTFSLSLPQ